MTIKTLTDLYHYFDEMVDKGASSDDLFASSYIRGFISLAASNYGDESQSISSELVNDVSKNIQASRAELSPDDRNVVNDYWQTLSTSFFN